MISIIRFFRNYNVYLMDHNDQLLDVGSFQRKIISYFLNRIDSIFVVGPHILEKYYKLIELNNESVWVENAFLPPPEEDRVSIKQTYPSEYFDFVKSKKNIINISAFKVKYEKGVDLYGIDMAIKSLAWLKQKGEVSSGLLIFIADASANSQELNPIRKLIKTNGLDDDVLFIFGQKELWPSYEDSSVSIRATCRDGFGVTVAESVYLGCPALASNVCSRARGAIIFESRNQDDLNAKVLELLSTAEKT
ncbi:MAG: glycosyltransferase [Gammaproteobacteria bacterium]|nr:glycosyltransferase [Gammaproteobacteria bacterium]